MINYSIVIIHTTVTYIMWYVYAYTLLVYGRVIYNPLQKNKVFNSLLQTCIFYPVTCLYFNLQTCENPVAVLPHRIVAGYFFACGTVYMHHNRPVVVCRQACC